MSDKDTPDFGILPANEEHETIAMGSFYSCALPEGTEYSPYPHTPFEIDIQKVLVKDNRTLKQKFNFLQYRWCAEEPQQIQFAIGTDALAHIHEMLCGYEMTDEEYDQYHKDLEEDGIEVI